MLDVLVIGGGAAGFYGAIHIATINPRLNVAILERGKQVLSKVKVSGGGRCNVTHAEFDPKQLALNYPRGGKELLGPFYTHNVADTMSFFESRGVALKVEGDGRVFPVTNSSQTIIDCLLSEVERLNIRLIKNSPVLAIKPLEADAEYLSGSWEVKTVNQTYRTHKILLATGSSAKIWHLLKGLGHTIIAPVPSLFTFNIKDARIAGIQGVSTEARVGLLAKKTATSKITVSLRSQLAETVSLETEGPLLITHWGLSGPAILKMSALGAKIMHDYQYRFKVRINWLPDYHQGAVASLLLQVKELEAKKTVFRTQAFDLPRRLWSRLVLAAGIEKELKWAAITKGQLHALVQQLTSSEFQVDGKSTFKEEFVTAGGVDLKEIDFRTFASKRLPNLYFAGEIINVDAVTGGYNFQNAWTGAYIAAKAIATPENTNLHTKR